jgi:hypothetical protein
MVEWLSKVDGNEQRRKQQMTAQTFDVDATNIANSFIREFGFSEAIARHKMQLDFMSNQSDTPKGALKFWVEVGEAIKAKKGN